MFGTEPSARMQWDPSTVRPSVRVTVTASPDAGHRLHPRLRQHLHAAAGEHVLQHHRGVRVLAGQHPVARGDQGDVDAEREVRRGELRPGHAGADHHQLLRHLVDVVDLLPGQDPLAVGLRGGQRARGGAGGDQDRVGVERLLRAVVGGDHDPLGSVQATAAAHDPHVLAVQPGGDVRRLLGGEPLHARVDRREVDARRWSRRRPRGRGSSRPARRRRRPRSSARRSRSGSCWARSR